MSLRPDMMFPPPIHEMENMSLGETNYHPPPYIPPQGFDMKRRESVQHQITPLMKKNSPMKLGSKKFEPKFDS